METDDDTFIVIIGEDSENDQEESLPAQIEIKQENTVSEHSDVNQQSLRDLFNCIQTNNVNEVLIDIDMSIVKEELEDNEETSPNSIKGESDAEADEDYVADNQYDEDDDSDENNKRGDHRYRPVKPHERKSYIKELKVQYPELAEDKELLISCLVEIMKSTKPPTLPQDYFVMNGIMLECLECGCHSESIPAAGRHYQERHGERYLYCFACGVNFRSKTNLYKHEKRCNAPDAKTVLRARARTLGRKARSRPYIANVPKDPPKRFACSECSASFNSKLALQAHEHMHRGERPHRCPACPAAYTSHTVLSRHMKKHGGVDYVCDHCQRAFKQKSALVVHMDTHRPQKRFGCDMCPKRYSHKAALVLHVNREHRHLPPPCACMVCPKRYHRTSLLKEHMKNVHGMNIMTRKMFFKKFPTMSETHLQEAKVILKSEVNDPEYDVYNI